MLTFQQINKLGEIFNSTFGKATDKGYGLKCSFDGNKMALNYHVVVYFASEGNLRDQVIKSEAEANEIVNEALAAAKRDYREITGNTVKFSEAGSKDSVEMVSVSTTSPRKVAYYRKLFVFEIS